MTVSLVLFWPAALAFGAVWIPCFLATGYVSLSSILGAAALPAASWLGGADPALTGFFAALAAFVAWKHRSNLRRLLAGTESRMRGGRPEDGGGTPLTGR